MRTSSQRRLNQILIFCKYSESREENEEKALLSRSLPEAHPILYYIIPIIVNAGRQGEEKQSFFRSYPRRIITLFKYTKNMQSHTGAGLFGLYYRIRTFSNTAQSLGKKKKVYICLFKYECLSMKILRTFVLTAIFAAVFALEAGAQNDGAKGRLSGSYETNTILYVSDSKTNDGSGLERDWFGSNNYMKLDYVRGRFYAGIQYEFYTPVLRGFDPYFRGGRLANKFVGWDDGNFSVIVGDFYEQFGSGLILRAYEDRALGFNNSLEGAKVAYRFGDILTVKGIWARPRMHLDYAEAWVRGADISLSVSDLLGFGKHYLALEGSLLNRNEPIPIGSIYDDVDGLKSDVNSWSGRLNFETDGGFFLRAEYAEKSRDHYVEEGLDKALTGNAQLVEMGYNGHGLGILATARRLNHMGTKIMREDDEWGDANILNYLPALTRQYTYMLTTLDPYVTEINGEQGGQLDVFYNFRKGSALGGKHGMKIHVNSSVFFPLEKVGDKMNMLFFDLSADLEKQWNRKFKTTLFYSRQALNKDHGATGNMNVSNIFVADMLYRFTTKNSLRVELQYLYSKRDPKDWVAALAEFSFAPRWSVYVSDMYNHGSEKTHYYNGGFSYTHSRTRVAISYGRNRKGFICSGGVCREMPAYTGANIAITTSF